MMNMPLSYGQAALWFLQKRFPESTAYNEGLSVILEHVDLDRLERALQQLFTLHPMLRCTFGDRQGTPFYRIGEHAGECQRILLDDCNDEKICDRINADHNQPFDLSQYCIRIRLYLRPNRQLVMSVTIHHIVCDGWSLKILWHDLLQCYHNDGRAAMTNGHAGYDAFVSKEAIFVSSEQGREILAILRNTFVGLSDQDSPFTGNRPANGCLRAGYWNFSVPASLNGRIRAYCRTGGFGVFDLLLSVFKLTLFYFTRQQDNFVGTPFLNRSADFRGTAGLFVNSMGIRNKIRPDMTFSSFVASVRQSVKSMAACSAVPLGQVIEVQPSHSGTPAFFEYFFTLRHKQFDISLSPSGPAFGGSSFRYRTLENPVRDHAAFDIHLEMMETADGLKATLCYNADLLDKPMVFSFERQFLRILSRAMNDASVSLDALAALDPAEESILCRLGSGAVERLEPGVGMSGWVHRQVKAGADRPAVLDGRGEEWSYGELWERVLSVSGWLRSRGVGVGGDRVVVGVSLERRCGWLAVVLGIWRAGGIYLPLDRDLPAERRHYMAEDAGARWVITDGHWEAGTGVETVEWTDLLSETGSGSGTETETGSADEEGQAYGCSRDDGSYLIYTSGSTGRPKGVLVGSEGVINHLWSKVRDLGLGQESRVAQSASMGFDVSVWQLGAVLLTGGLVRLYERWEVLEAGEYGRKLQEEGITVVQMVPSYVGVFLEQVRAEEGLRLKGLRYLVTAGEELRPSTVKSWMERYGHVRIANCYGPTEATDNASMQVIEEGEGMERSRVPIGRPLRNVRLYVLDRGGLGLVPRGILGEIGIGGIGVSEGYVGQSAARTGEVFVSDPYWIGGRLYRTGDLGRWNERGELEYHGRSDRQVKVRGQRLELGEVERVAQEHAGVKAVAVVYRGDEQGGSLRGYVVWKGEPKTETEAEAETEAEGLRSWLAERLPGYMVPAHWVGLEELPETSSGKVDYRQLEGRREEKEQGVQEPWTEVERELGRLWSEVLGVERIGREENFFQLGGHSLSAMRLTAAIASRLKIELPVSSLLTFPCIGQLAGEIGRRSTVTVTEPLPASGPWPASYQQEWLWSVCSRSAKACAAYNMVGAYDIHDAPDPAKLEASIRIVVGRHESLRTTFAIREGALIQEIHPLLTPFFRQETVSESDFQSRVEALLHEESAHVFDLGSDCLLRISIIRSDAGKMTLVGNLHHLVADAISLRLLWNEIARCLDNGMDNSTVDIIPVTQYREFSLWQRRIINEADFLRSAEFLHAILAEARPLLVPADLGRNGDKTFSAGSIAFLLDDRYAPIRELASQLGVPVPAIAVVSVYLLLALLTGENRLTTGLVLSGRSDFPGANLIGPCINTLPLMTYIDWAEPLCDLITRVHAGMIGLQKHEGYPNVLLLREDPAAADILSGVLINYLRVPGADDPCHRLFAASEPVTLSGSKADLEFEWLESPLGLSFRLRYDRDLFSSVAAECFGDQLSVLLDTCCKAAAQPAALIFTALTPAMSDYRRRHPAAAQPGRVIHRTSSLELEKQDDPATASGVPAILSALWQGILGKQYLSEKSNFFRLGGHSLNALQLISAIYRQTGVQIAFHELFSHPELGAMAALIGSRGKDAFAEISKAPEERFYPVTPSQKRLWILHQLEASASAYNISGAFILTGRLRPSAVLAAFEEIVWRHEMLRTGFVEKDDEIRQFVLPYEYGRSFLRYEDAEGTDALSLVREEYGHVFDLARGSLFRIRLVRLGPDRHLLSCVLHHLIGDGLSLQLIIEEFNDVYRRIVEKDDAVMTSVNGRPAAIRYVDYAVWLQRQLSSPSMDSSARYWQTKLNQDDHRLHLPTDRPRLADQTYNGAIVTARLEGSAFTRLKTVAGQHNTSLFTVFLTALNILLHRCTGQRRISLGNIVSGREHPQLQDLVGCFINTVVLAAELNPDQPLRSALDDIRSMAMESSRHQQYPFDFLLERITAGREPNRAALIDVLLNYQISPGDSLRLPDVTVERYEDSEGVISKMDLEVDAVEEKDRLTVQLIYNCDLFDRSTAAAWLSSLTNLLELVGDKDRLDMRISDLPLKGLSPVSPERDVVPAPIDLSVAERQDGTSLEQRLHRIWSGLLGVNTFGPDDHFLRLGGHSLTAMRVAAAVRRELGVKLTLQQLFSAPTIRQQCRLIESLPVDPAEAGLIRRVADAPDYPVSHAQERMWSIGQQAELDPAYSISAALHLNGQQDPRAWDLAWDELITRQEELRTNFIFSDQGVRQRFADPADVRWALCHVEMPRGADITAAALAAAADQPDSRLSLTEGPLVRCTLYYGQDAALLYFTLHHILADEWSLGLLIRNLCRLYEEYNMVMPPASSERIASDPALAPVPAIRYRDYACWERNLPPETWEPGRMFWQQQLKGALPFAELPVDNTIGTATNSRGGSVSVILPGVGKDLTDKAAAVDGTPFMALVAAVSLLIGKYCHRDDLVIGAPVSGRSRPELQQAIGLFLNTVPLRIRLDRDRSFSGLLSSVRQCVLEAFAHQDFPFDLLVRDLLANEGLDPQRLFNVTVVLHDDAPESAPIPRSEWVTLQTTRSKFPLSFHFTILGPDLKAALVYNSTLFSAARARLILDHFVELLESALSEPFRAVGELSYIPAAERNLLTPPDRNTPTGPDRDILTTSDLNTPTGPDRDILTVLDAVWRHKGSQWMLRGLEGGLRYGEAGELSDRIASVLRSVYGVKPGSVVGLWLDPGVEWVVSMLGVLKAGGTYLPLDRDFPLSRLSWIAEDSGAELVIGTAGWEGPERSVSYPELLAAGAGSSEPEKAAGRTAESVAYLIYTSGSTGRPKGVEVRDGSVVNYVKGIGSVYGWKGQELRGLLCSSPAFDLGYTCLWGMLLSGGCLYMGLEGGHWEPRKVLDRIDKEGITIVKLTPSHFRLLRQAAEDRGRGGESLRWVVLGGERIEGQEVRWWLERYPRSRVANHYGPTETTIGVLTQVVGWEEGEGMMGIEEFCRRPVLGRAMGGHRVYVVDEWGGLCGRGVWGELWIGGPGVSRGYRNRGELNEEKFVADKFRLTGEKVYRTGDRCRWDMEGRIEFGGRLDGQVKWKGYRIEPGEIESVLVEMKGVKSAAVGLKGEGPGERLVAYVVAEGEKAIETEWRSILRSRLPGYMLPSCFVWLSALPLTGNGKIDRQGLPDPEEEEGEEEREVVKASGDREERLLWALEGVMGRKGLSMGDDFFGLGGDSIRAIQVSSRLYREGWELEVKDIFGYPVLSEMAGRMRPLQGSIDQGPVEDIGFIRPASVQPDYNVSAAQRRLWFIYQLEDNPTVYNTLSAVTISGPFNQLAFDQTVAALLERHESLRTVIRISDNHPRLMIRKPADLAIQDFLDLSADADPETRLQVLFREEAGHRFDLTTGPLVRIRLVRMTSQQQVFVMNMHHIICDGWSKTILQREFYQLYAGFTADRPLSLPPLVFQYRDYAAWQQRLLESGRMAPHREYWLRELSGELPILQLPLDFPRPAMRRYASQKVRFAIGADTSASIARAAAAAGATEFTVLLAAIHILLRRYTGQDDIITGIPIAGRSLPEWDGLVGLFLNLLPIRGRFDDNETFRSFLHKIKSVAAEAYSHGDYPFDALVDELRLRRDLSRSALFDVLVVSEDFAAIGPHANTTTLHLEERETGFSGNKFDLTFYLQLSPEGTVVTVGYNSLLFSDSRMQQLGGHFTRLLEQLLAGPDRDIYSLPYLSAPELKAAWKGFNDTAYPYSKYKTLHGLFEEQASVRPEGTAIRYRGQNCSYRELDARANSIARALLDAGCRNGDLVGLLTGRHFGMIGGMLGILKAGGAYVPIDPVYPVDRQEYILRHSGVRFLVTDDLELAALAAGDTPGIVILDLVAIDTVAADTKAPRAEKSSADLAYVIFTSGSSGRPKGVMIEHQMAVNLVEWVNREFKVNAGDRLLFVTSICFDLSVYDIFGALAAGACIVIAEPDDIRDLQRLKQLLISERITFWDSVPTTLNYLVTELLHSSDGFCQTDLRVIFLSGDWIPVSLPRQALDFFPAAQIVSLGGATEGTVWSNWFPIDRVDEKWLSIPYGRPIANNLFYILDKGLNPVPPGVIGELFIGGVGVSRGYISDPEKTAAAFMPDPFCVTMGGMMYRTGDLGRMLPDGNMEFLGRKDFQVKIRGFRVELGEIEQVLAQFPGIGPVLVNAFGEAAGTKWLVAYYIGDSTPLPGALSAFLAERLPDYMIPSYYMRLDAWPLNANGKVDRKALPEPDRRDHESMIRLPETETQTELHAIWQDILNRGAISVQDNFFMLGGHSLSASQVVARINERLGVSIRLRSVFLYPTIETLAREVEALQWLQAQTGGVVEQEKILI